MKFGSLVFDEINTRHIARHKIKPDEIKEIFKREILEAPAKKGRILIVRIIGKNKILSVILERMESNSFYVVTARPASRKERKLYSEKIGGEQNDKNHKKN